MKRLIPRPLVGRRRLAGRLVANGLAQAATTWGSALLVESAFDRLVDGDRVSGTALAGYGLAMIAAASAAAGLRGLERVDAERLGQGYTSELRGALHRHLLRSSSRALQRRSQGATMLRFVGDLNAIRQWVSLGLARLVVAGALTAGTLVALATTSVALSVTLAVTLLLGAAAALSQGPGVRAAARDARRRRARLAANVDEQVGAIAVVQAFGQERRERRRLRRQSRALEQAMVALAGRLGVLRALTEATSALAASAVLLVGATEVAAGHITRGTVVAAMTLVHRLGHPLRDLGRVQELWHSSRVALGKLEELLTAPTRLTVVSGAPALEPAWGRLDLVGVCLDGALADVDATAEGGSVVAIVGANGAGKSTLLALIARLVDLDAGTVLLDGSDLAAHDLASVRQAVGMAGPDLPLLRGTVAHNLTYRKPDATPDELAEVIDRCVLQPVIDELGGLDARITEGGRNLSAGQRQRLALGRALLGNPMLLLLDEADANLDAVAVDVIDRVLAQHTGTVLLVTHRLDRVRTADQVWHIDGGRLIATGAPAELLDGDGPTAALFARAAHAS